MYHGVRCTSILENLRMATQFIGSKFRVLRHVVESDVTNAGPRSKSTSSVLTFDPSLAIRIKCSHESAVSSLDAEVIDANVSGLH